MRPGLVGAALKDTEGASAGTAPEVFTRGERSMPALVILHKQVFARLPSQACCVRTHLDSPPPWPEGAGAPAMPRHSGTCGTARPVCGGWARSQGRRGLS